MIFAQLCLLSASLVIFIVIVIFVFFGVVVVDIFLH